MSELIAKSIPWILPAFFVVCWLYTHKTPKIGGGKKEPKEEKKEESQSLSDRDMSSP